MREEKHNNWKGNALSHYSLLWLTRFCSRLLLLLGFKLFSVKGICFGVPYTFQLFLIYFHELILDNIRCIVCSISLLSWLEGILRTAIFNLLIGTLVLFVCWFYFFLGILWKHWSKWLISGQFEHSLICVRRQHLLEVIFVKRLDLLWKDWVDQFFTSPAHESLCDCKRTL